VSSVVGDSQISSTKYRRNLIAAVELAVICSELCFARPLNLETYGLEQKVTEFKK